MCRALGSRLAELETVEENQDIVAFLQATSALRGSVLLLYFTILLSHKLLYIILWHVDPFLGNDREIINYTTAVAS
jgi:hypothetical protein